MIRRSRLGRHAAVWGVLFLAPVVVISAGLIWMMYSLAARGANTSSAGDIAPAAVSSCLPAEAVSADVRDYTSEQLANAATIIEVGKRMGVPSEGWVIALATSIQESGLRNLRYGDRDSLGLFQQRPSQGWGTPAQITNPSYAATQFYEHLLALPRWQRMSLTRAAQAVQRSAFPLAYAAHEQAARYLVGLVQDSACADDTSDGAWVAPVDGACTSGFGRRGASTHGGLDIAAPIGATIMAAGTGKVIDAGPARGFGLWVRIRHPDGAVTTYGHNHRNLVEPGETVRAGQPIAKVGSRGRSTGPHLHFEVSLDGRTVPPARFYQQHQAPPLC